jgi:diacylglycerol kinase family enzyme
MRKGDGTGHAGHSVNGKRALKRIEAVVNVASGGVGPDAPDALEALLADSGVEFRVAAPEAGDLERALAEAVNAAPDLLVVLAGDGTARAAAELCGPRGPLLAPLPGGTMNMLPHAVYGEVDWPTALKAALSRGHEQTIAGGDVGGHRFLVAAILGAPALWGPAREAARGANLRRAVLRARVAWRRSFSSRLRYTLDGGAQNKAEALLFMCPIASRAVSSDARALEVAGFSPSGAVEAGRLGFHAMFGDWRNDPAVEVELCRSAHIWSRRSIPALLDGELVRLESLAEVRFEPEVVRVLAAPKDAEP